MMQCLLELATYLGSLTSIQTQRSLPAQVDTPASMAIGKVSGQLTLLFGPPSRAVGTSMNRFRSRPSG